MNIRKILILVLILTSFSLAGCGKTVKEAALTGILEHTHPMDVPAGWVISIQVLDTTNTKSPAKVVAENVIQSQGIQLPVPFEVVYDPRKIKEDHTYVVVAALKNPTGATVYSTTRGVPVITSGNSIQRIEVVVQLTGG